MLNQKHIDFLEKNTVFYNKLDKKEKDIVANHSYATNFNIGNTIHIGDESCTGFIIVTSGCLRIFLNSPDGKEITLYKLLKGDSCIFSAACIFNNINFRVNIEAFEDTEVIILPSNQLDDLSKGNPLIKEYILQLTQSKMSDVMWLLEQILFTSFDERLKNYLLEFNTNVINITHSTIAKDLGTAREVVSRMLKHFENQGMIRLSRGEIEIINI
ncbi:MAG: Crp/Fnr family transcriptional regulator [Clostridium sp.]